MGWRGKWGGSFGNYGVLGVQSPTNLIGTRQLTVNWITSNGNMYVFGGYGNALNSGDDLNDLWVYSPKIPVSQSDSLALVDLYNSTNGANWTNHTNWLTAPVDTWYGVSVVNGRVTMLSLYRNQLKGNIPSSLGNVSKLKTLWLFNNQLLDSIPSSIGNLTDLNDFSLENNELSGEIPSSLGGLKNLLYLSLYNNLFTGTIPISFGNLSNLISLGIENNFLSGNIYSSLNSLNNLTYLDITENNFTFDGIEQIVQKFGFAIYSPQRNIPLIKNENLFSVSAGGTLQNDTFHLYQNAVLNKVQIGNPTFSIQDTGKYFMTATNSIAKLLTLYTDTVTVGFSLADTTTTVSQNITGISPVDVNEEIYKLISVTPKAGSSQLNGNVSTTITLDSNISSFRSIPYVQRHYDITPASNPSTAEAIVTLYFLQSEFDAYNTYVTTHSLGLPSLPTGGIDNGNINVTQFHGTGTAPGNYTGSSLIIIPAVAWNAASNWWKLTFPVNGFSGFYVSTANIALPITLLNFTGSLKNKSASLNWQTATEINSNHFNIQRSTNGVNFITIGKMNAAGNSSSVKSYNYTDNVESLNAGIMYYRLAETDIDGKITLSEIRSVKISNNRFLTLSPNPAKSIVTITGNNLQQVKIYDASGKLQLSQRINNRNNVPINISNLPKGHYFVELTDNEGNRETKKLVVY